ncbi:hypothetical protein EK904_002417, partial [Melospiza melodia maxima]
MNSPAHGIGMVSAEQEHLVSVDSTEGAIMQKGFLGTNNPSSCCGLEISPGPEASVSRGAGCTPLAGQSPGHCNLPLLEEIPLFWKTVISSVADWMKLISATQPLSNEVLQDTLKCKYMSETEHVLQILLLNE